MSHTYPDTVLQQKYIYVFPFFLFDWHEKEKQLYKKHGYIKEPPQYHIDNSILKKSTYKIVFSVWFQIIILIKPDSVQNGVGLLRLSIRLVKLQSKLSLLIEMTITMIAIHAIHIYI